jgi:hypothetical protein
MQHRSNEETHADGLSPRMSETGRSVFFLAYVKGRRTGIPDPGAPLALQDGTLFPNTSRSSGHASRDPYSVSTQSVLRVILHQLASTLSFHKLTCAPELVQTMFMPRNVGQRERV